MVVVVVCVCVGGGGGGGGIPPRILGYNIMVIKMVKHLVALALVL